MQIAFFRKEKLAGKAKMGNNLKVGRLKKTICYEIEKCTNKGISQIRYFQSVFLRPRKKTD